MKKISILSLHLGYGGIEKSIAALANLLCSKYKVEIACVYKLYDKPVFELDDRVKIKYLTDVKPNKRDFENAMHKKNIFKIVKEGLRSVNILRLRKLNTINYIINSNSDIIISTRDIFDDWLGKYGSNEILKIGWEHNHHHNNIKYAREVVRSCNKLDYLVLVSKNLKNYYKKKLVNSNCKCIYIPNILDVMPSRLSKLNEKRLVSVGRLSKEKGYIDLLRIANILFKNHSNWTLDIIGDGPERKSLEKYIKEHNLSKNITLHGFQKKEYIDKVLNKSSIYLMTSYTESFGIVLIEAMSHGLPCIAFSSAEGAKELINSGCNGYLIKNRNSRAYIQKVEDLMKDIEIRKEIGKNGRTSIKKYCGEEVIKTWFKILEKK